LKFEPAKTSGGFTTDGFKTCIKTYRAIVREALHSGFYRDLIKAGKISLARVKEIVASAKLNTKETRQEKDLSLSSPKDWLIYGEHGCFILYDKKLKDFYTDDWNERFVYGMVLVRVNDTRKGNVGIIVRFGGNTDKIKAFLLMLAASYCATEKVPLMVDPDDMKYIDASKYNVAKEADLNSGMKRTKVVIKKKIDLRMVTSLEVLFRKQFDRHDEFRNSLIEIAHAKFDHLGKTI